MIPKNPVQHTLMLGCQEMLTKENVRYYQNPKQFIVLLMIR